MRDLLEKKNLIRYNLVNISIKTNSVININTIDNYKKADNKVYK